MIARHAIDVVCAAGSIPLSSRIVKIFVFLLKINRGPFLSISEPAPPVAPLLFASEKLHCKRDCLSKKGADP